MRGVRRFFLVATVVFGVCAISMSFVTNVNNHWDVAYDVETLCELWAMGFLGAYIGSRSR